MWRGLVLNDFKRADAGALNTASADVESALAIGSEKRGAGGRQIGIRIKITRDADSVLQDRRFDIVAGVNVDSPHQLNELAGFGGVVPPVLVNRFANEIKSHFQLFRMLYTER